MCQLFAREGARIIAVDIQEEANMETLKSLAQGLKSFYYHYHHYFVNFSFCSLSKKDDFFFVNCLLFFNI